MFSISPLIKSFEPISYNISKVINVQTKRVSFQRRLVGEANRNFILREVWGKVDYFAARTMDVYLSKIRKHLSADPSISLINIHGQGFILKESN